MAFSLPITAVRASSVQVQPAAGVSGAGYTLLVSYALCTSSGQAGAYTDVLVGRGERTLHEALTPGHPMPMPAELAALIRQDCQAAFGGQPDTVLLGGQPY